jgi:hypothetical protein
VCLDRPEGSNFSRVKTSCQRQAGSSCQQQATADGWYDVWHQQASTPERAMYTPHGCGTCQSEGCRVQDDLPSKLAHKW